MESKQKITKLEGDIILLRKENQEIKGKIKEKQTKLNKFDEINENTEIFFKTCKEDVDRFDEIKLKKLDNSNEEDTKKIIEIILTLSMRTYNIAKYIDNKESNNNEYKYVQVYIDKRKTDSNIKIEDFFDKNKERTKTSYTPPFLSVIYRIAKYCKVKEIDAMIKGYYISKKTLKP